MTLSVADKRASFRALHRTGCFVLPNPWDIGGVRRLENLGFKALATTSAGFAWSLGRLDGQVTLDEVLAHLRLMAASTDLPVNADFEAGFADAPRKVAANVALAIGTGIAGLSIEDRTGAELYPLSVAVERVAAARAAIDASGHDVLLVARTEGLLIGKLDVDSAIERLVAFRGAGADCLFAPGVKALPDIRGMVAAAGSTPLNVLLLGSGMDVAELAAAGVRRISTGGGLAAAAWSAFEHVATVLRDTGRVPDRPA
jgi:2-methylisocitrate lyase-like PEP mutase family enzyme